MNNVYPNRALSPTWPQAKARDPIHRAVFLRRFPGQALARKTAKTATPIVGRSAITVKNPVKRKCSCDPADFCRRCEIIRNILNITKATIVITYTRSANKTS